MVKSIGIDSAATNLSQFALKSAGVKSSIITVLHSFMLLNLIENERENQRQNATRIKTFDRRKRRKRASTKK